ncbi:hypothetical protein F5883DRAFT_553407 [Diaporthe sp. PMI_573]|nr:hypothetical protein F5883DRAFT_553407 [Diaporthaceae sp. PMI_573]
MTSTSMASVTSTILTVGGTPTIFLPLPTPYPSEEGCGTNIYQWMSTPPMFVVWDPFYGRGIVTDATTCHPPQVTTWWFQSSDALLYTALGPTFACPEAYSTVTTTVIESSVQQVYCCPSQFTFLSTLPNKGEVFAGEHFPSQCTSMLTEGQTLSWFTGMDSGTSLSSTTVFTSQATMVAVPVNGFNIATSSQTSQQDSTAVATSQTTTATSSQTSASSQSSSSSASSQSSSSSASSQSSSFSASSGTSTLGLSIGITLGVVFAVLLLGIAAFILWRRRRRARLARVPSEGSVRSKGSKSQGRAELNSESMVLETIPTPQTRTLAELPLTKPRSIHELAEPRSIFELPQRWQR